MPKVALISGFPFYAAIFPFSSTHLPFFLVPAFVFPLENCVVRAAATSFRLDCSSGLFPIPLDPKRESAQSRERESQRERERGAGRQRGRARESARQQLPLSANCTRNDLSEFRVKTDLRARPKSEHVASLCSPTTRSFPKPGTKKDTKLTRKSMKIPCYYPKQTKKVDKARPS